MTSFRANPFPQALTRTKSGATISTVYIGWLVKGGGFETAIMDDGIEPVERYTDLRDAIRGHLKFVRACGGERGWFW